MTNTTVRLNEEQRNRLQHMADMLRTSRNAIVGMLIDNARLEPVTKTEAVATLPTDVAATRNNAD